MTLMPYQPTLVTQYEGQQLTLFEEHREIVDANAYPVAWTETQFSTIRNKSRVFSILTDTSREPSSSVNLPQQGLCNVAVRLDAAYRTNLTSYKQMLLTAIQSDAGTIRRLEKMPVFEGFMGDARTKVAEWSIIVFRLCSGHANFVIQEGSCFRIACLIEIGALEQSRIDNMKLVITQSCKPLLEELDELAEKNETDVEKLSSLDQLEKIYQNEFGESLEIDGQNVREYINEKINDLGLAL
ncbi:MAG: hypothetical protein P4L16_06380 [Chlamydiales bacterium]|nr:hypothetical protein [Chlamydiales bacterium]